MVKPSLFLKAKDYIAGRYGDDIGKMLVHTGVIGWILSSAAQVAAIVINDKIPKEQKMFLIPQEIADAGVNIASFYLITQSFKSVASKLLTTGKWAPKVVKDFLSKNKLADKIGKTDFNLFKDVKMPPDVLDKATDFRDGVDVVATTAGSILSCNIVTPLLRNEIAAHRQKTLIGKMNGTDKKQESAVVGQKPVSEKNIARMNDFQSLAYNKFSSSSLKV